MSLGNDLISGFTAVRDAKEKRKRREQDAQMAAAERALKLDLQARDMTAQQALQNDRLVADAKRQFSDQSWRSGESATDRSWRSNESAADRTWKTGDRQEAQKFTAGENDAERRMRKLLQDDALKATAAQFRDKLDFDYTNLGANTAMKTRDQNWQENPENPYNRIRDTQADRNENDLAEMYGSNSATGMPPPDSGKFRSSQPATMPKFGQADEGRTLIGPDGKRYRVIKGVAVLQ